MSSKLLRGLMQFRCRASVTANQPSAPLCTNKTLVRLEKAINDDRTTQKVVKRLDAALRKHDAEQSETDMAAANEARIAEVMEYYSQYEKELGYSRTDDDEMWLATSRQTEGHSWPVSLQRGQQGVFDAHEVVEVLRDQRVADVCCVAVPPHLGYVQHLVIGSAFSLKHIGSVAACFYKLYKKKRADSDAPGLVKSPKGQDWTALDLGNVAVHLMMPGTRLQYDIEMLWAVGPQFDPLTLAKTGTELLEDEFDDFRRQIEAERLQNAPPQQTNMET